MKKEPNNPRHRFYLAQSYKDAKCPKKSIKNYYKRITCCNSGWSEEVYYSYLMIGQQLKSLGTSSEEWLPVYLEAYKLFPNRMEAPYFIVDHYLSVKDYQTSHKYGKKSSLLEKYNNGLFFIDNVYDYLMYDTYSICAYWAGDYDDSAYFCNMLLDEKKIQPKHIPRVEKNLVLALEKMSLENTKYNIEKILSMTTSERSSVLKDLTKKDINSSSSSSVSKDEDLREKLRNRIHNMKSTRSSNHRRGKQTLNKKRKGKNKLNNKSAKTSILENIPTLQEAINESIDEE